MSRTELPQLVQRLLPKFDPARVRCSREEFIFNVEDVELRTALVGEARSARIRGSGRFREVNSSQDASWRNHRHSSGTV
jgi:hypothetical protein